MQYGLFTGYTAAVGWDPETAHLTDEGGAGTATYARPLYRYLETYTICFLPGITLLWCSVAVNS